MIEFIFAYAFLFCGSTGLYLLRYGRPQVDTAIWLALIAIPFAAVAAWVGAMVTS